jgi:hypothetical protein
MDRHLITVRPDHRRAAGRVGRILDVKTSPETGQIRLLGDFFTVSVGI